MPRSGDFGSRGLIRSRANPACRTKLNHSNFANRSGLVPAMGHSNFCPISCDVSVVD